MGNIFSCCNENSNTPMKAEQAPLLKSYNQEIEPTPTPREPNQNKMVSTSSSHSSSSSIIMTPNINSNSHSNPNLNLNANPKANSSRNLSRNSNINPNSIPNVDPSLNSNTNVNSNEAQIINLNSTTNSSNSSVNQITQEPSTQETSSQSTTPNESGPQVLFHNLSKKKTKVDTRGRQAGYRRNKNNSTNTLFVHDTMEDPCIDDMLRCMSIALIYHISPTKQTQLRPNVTEIFDEELHPLTPEPLDLSRVPPAEQVFAFIEGIFKNHFLATECVMLCMAYIERLIIESKLKMDVTNWRRIVLGAFMLACKVWEEDAVYNADFLDSCPAETSEGLNKLEKRFLEGIKYNVSLKASQYAKYFFELRALSEIPEEEQEFPFKSLERAQLLEERSLEKERLEKELVMKRRVKSMADIHLKDYEHGYHSFI